jgi:hypothetical protein
MYKFRFKWLHAFVLHGYEQDVKRLRNQTTLFLMIQILTYFGVNFKALSVEWAEAPDVISSNTGERVQLLHTLLRSSDDGVTLAPKHEKLFN